MKRCGIALTAAWVLAVGPISAGAAEGTASGGKGGMGAVQAGVHGSTLGWGLSAGYDVSESWSVRALINRLDYDFERTKSGNRFKGDLELQSFGLVMDWRPFGGGFRMTGGAFVNGNELAVRAKGARLDIGGRKYTGNLDLKADFRTLAPYFGVGYGSGQGRTGFSFVFDAGLLFQGSPDLSASGSVASGSLGSCRFTVGKGGRATLAGSDSCASLDSLKTDIEKEHDKLSDDLDDFDLWPVVLLGASYRF